MGLLSFLKRGEAEDGGKAAKPAKNTRASVDAVDDVQQLRLRARRRLIGAAVLVGVAVIVFPLLFETQPRPIPVDLPIDIPKKDGAAPLNVPAPKVARTDDTVDPKEAGRAAIITETAEQAAADRAVPPPETRDTTRDVPREVTREATREVTREVTREGSPDPAARTDVKPDARARIAEPAHADPRPKPSDTRPADTKVAAKPDTRVEPKPDAKADRRPATGNESARVQALLEGHANERNNDRKAADAATSGARFIVQVGAYADAKAAQDARAKVERMGLKTYTQAVETPDGKRIRVRVGPFGTRDEADKVAAKVRGGGLSSAVLTL
ncbi:SPOR domain-containing protein [Roseateles sp. SL47]|uniref:SPOR domain-containing protein n=1 Tax=Roseateles sp. SL47 TaxID=2995138 RepID=UPI0022706A8B|nr:SPOR domain-containing protein [Roseateles sp. SL47]WAC71883.1 SPOR domain-containing protein [Roseateles sp. SL47]